MISGVRLFRKASSACLEVVLGSESLLLLLEVEVMVGSSIDGGMGCVVLCCYCLVTI